jgi:N6-adenosine-specific RNA methylase IME4
MKVDIFNTNKKYSIIYADPPWQYKVWSNKGKSRTAESHYPTMTKTDIQNLPIPSLCENNSVLFLWVTYPCLEEGLELIRAWGFTYKTVAFTWVKQNKKSDSFFMGMGYYTRANAEYCLLATKGKILERKSRAVHSVVCTHIERHSKKPNEVRDRIVQLFGDIPRIELFARQTVDGWDCWGNEV